MVFFLQSALEENLVHNITCSTCICGTVALFHIRMQQTPRIWEWKFSEIAWVPKHDVNFAYIYICMSPGNGKHMSILIVRKQTYQYVFGLAVAETTFKETGSVSERLWSRSPTQRPQTSRCPFPVCMHIDYSTLGTMISCGLHWFLECIFTGGCGVGLCSLATCRCKEIRKVPRMATRTISNIASYGTAKTMWYFLLLIGNTLFSTQIRWQEIHWWS